MLIVFDLDGTLIDSTKDLEISVNTTREHFDLPPLDAKLIHSYVGNGSQVLISRAMGPDANESFIDEAHEFFLRFYRAHALEHTRLYPGIRELLDELASRDLAMAVLTNKPARISFDILSALQVQERFFRIYGGNSIPTKKPDPAGLDLLRAEAECTKAETLMVGDSSVDVLTARNAGVKVCGVLWGIQPESFQLHPPDYVITTPEELLPYLNHSHPEEGDNATPPNPEPKRYNDPGLPSH